MTEKQKKLAEDNHNLIYSLLHRMNLNIDDHYGTAAIGLCEAAMAYDSDRGTKFATLAYRCMRNRLSQDHRKASMKKRTGTVVQLDWAIDENGTAPLGTVPARENTEIQAMARDTLRQLFSDPDPRNRKIYYLLGRGYNQQEVAARVNISQSWVSRVQRTAKLATM